MHRHARTLAAPLAGLAAIALLASAPALAQQQTTITKFSGTVTGAQATNGIAGTAATGTWTRTITDVEPNGPNGGSIQATFNVQVPWTSGLSADSVAARYRKAADETLPGPLTGATGYGTANQLYRDFAAVRLARQGATYSFSDASLPPGVTISTNPPLNAEDAPIASPAGLAALAATLSALAYWARRRRMRG